jgi:triacylglycerol lipase
MLALHLQDRVDESKSILMPTDNKSQDYPIVLAHGIARFDALTTGLLRKINQFLWDFSFEFDRLHYFKGVASYLKRHGFDVHATSVSYAASVEVRAADLAEQVRQILRETGQEKVHIIGHSMGGLDARQMIFQEQEMADKVASVTSIGTPHNGTVLADYVLAGGGEYLIAALRPFIDATGFLTLTLDKRAQFNEMAQDWEARNPVVYQVYAGFQDYEQIMRLLKESHQFILEADGKNDGLVSVSSQLWVSELVAADGAIKQIRQRPFPLPVDHLNETGWWDLQELSGTRWWRRNLRKEKRAFETAVKEAYLHIAREITTAVPPA